MSRKNNPVQFPNIVNGDMSHASIISSVTSIRFLDNVGIQLNFSGSPVGEFAVQVSADHMQDDFGNVTVPGNWVPLIFTYWNGTLFVTGNNIPTTVGSPIYLDLNQLSAPWIRVVYTKTSGSGTLNGVIVMKSV